MPRLTDKERTAIANELVRRVDTVSLLYSSCRLANAPKGGPVEVRFACENPVDFLSWQAARKTSTTSR
jgi:hypothetical protein